MTMKTHSHLKYFVNHSSGSQASEYWRELSLQVSIVCSNGNHWCRFNVVWGFEVRSLLSALNWLLALYELQGVLLVGRELLQSLVVAFLRGVRGLESLVVKWLVGVDVLLGGNLLLLLGQRHVCSKYFLNRIEGILLSGHLREGFLLNLSFMLQTLLSKKLALGVKGIWHVGQVSTKAGLLADLTYLWWIS